MRLGHDLGRGGGGVLAVEVRRAGIWIWWGCSCSLSSEARLTPPLCIYDQKEHKHHLAEHDYSHVRGWGVLRED